METQVVHNAAEQIARAELEACTARMMFQIGFSHANESSLDILCDLTRKYIQKMCATLRWVSEHCGRTQISMGDVEYTYRKMNIDVDEMNEYMLQIRSYKPLRLHPRLATNIVICPYKNRQELPSPNHHPDFPSWVPTTCTYNASQQQNNSPTENKQSLHLRVPVFPDFSDQNAISLGLCKLKRYQEPPKPTVHQRPMHPHHSLKRPSSSCSISQPPSRPLSRLSQPKTVEPEPEHRAKSPDLDFPIISTPNVPMFKRRLVKRRSDETPTPPPSAPSPSLIGKLRNEHSSVLDLIQTVSSRPASPASQVPVATTQVQSIPPQFNRVQANNNVQNNILTVASDLVRDPGAVVSAALAGRSAPSLPPPTVPIARNSVNLYDPPEDDEQPTRIVQMAILRHLFTLESTMSDQISQAFDQIAGNRDKTPPQEVLHKPVYHIVRNEPPPVEEPMRILPPLKIRISRGCEDMESIEPSPISVISQSPTETDDSDDGMERKRRHKKKKKKKKKHRQQMDEIDLDSSQPSPCEIKDDGGAIRMKIRLRPPSRPSSNAS